MLYSILLVIGAAAVFAFLVVKFLPLKLRWLVSLICLVASGYLGYLIYESVTLPIKFEVEKEKRYAKVIKKLKLIRDAEEKYRDVTGKFTANEDSLVNFIKNGKLYITQVKNITEEVILAGGIKSEKSVSKIDTIGVEPVSKYFKGRDVEGLFDVPDLDGQQFKVVAKSIEVEGALVLKSIIQVFEAKIEKKAVLRGLDDNEIKLEMYREETDQIKGKYISLGSLEETSLKGNWPKSYDTQDILKRKKEKEALKKASKK